MSTISKSISNYRKHVSRTDRGGVGYKAIRFFHQATAGQTDIDLTNLTMPTSLSALGYANPNASDLAAANLAFFQNNFRLTSSINGELMAGISFDIITSTRIRLKGSAIAQSGEIFIGVIDPKPITGIVAADGIAVTQTGLLPVGEVDFVVGEPFTWNKYSSQQIGDVLVYREGILQRRCVGNLIAGEGDYIELAPTAGNLSNTIRFKNAPTSTPAKIVVVSNGLVAERPTAAVLARVETLAGQIDQIVVDLAQVTGNPTSRYQTAPNSVDLSIFGELVKSLLTRVFATRVVGSASDVAAGRATHTSVQQAINDCPAGGLVYIMSGTYVENISLTKNLMIQGQGYGSFINGTFSAGAGCVGSLVKFLRFGGNISISAGANSNIINESWLLSTATLTDLGTDNVTHPIVDY